MDARLQSFFLLVHACLQSLSLLIDTRLPGLSLRLEFCLRLKRMNRICLGGLIIHTPFFSHEIICDKCSLRQHIAERIADDPHGPSKFLELRKLLVQLYHCQSRNNNVQDIEQIHKKKDPPAVFFGYQRYTVPDQDRMKIPYDQNNSHAPDEREPETYIPAQVKFLISVVPPAGMKKLIQQEASHELGERREDHSGQIEDRQGYAHDIACI